MKYDYGILCESAIVDSQTNYLSLIKIVESFNFLDFPGKLPRLNIVTMWFKTKNLGKPQSIDARFSLINSNTEDSEAIPRIEFKINVPGDKKNMRAILEVSGITIHRAGEYNFRVEIKDNTSWNKVGEIRFDVTSNPLPSEVIGLPKP